MALQMIDIAGAKTSYLTNKINAKLTGPIPSSGQTINVGEQFTFSVKISNASVANGGVNLINVSYEFRMGHFGTPAFDLIVPPKAKGVATDTRAGDNTYAPGQLVDSYYLHHKYVIAAGDVVVIDDLAGVAQKQGSGAVHCLVWFTFQPLADLDNSTASAVFSIV